MPAYVGEGLAPPGSTHPDMELAPVKRIVGRVGAAFGRPLIPAEI